MFDFIALAIILFAMLLGLWRGLVQALLALLTWLVAIAIATYYQANMVARLSAHINNETWVNVIAFLSLLLPVLFIGWVLCAVIKLFLPWNVSLVSRCLGGLVGIVRGTIIAMVFIFCVGNPSWGVWRQHRWAKTSSSLDIVTAVVAKLPQLD